MPQNSFNEDSFFFLPLETLCRKPVITCGPELGIVAMAKLMSEHNISGMIVEEEGMPVGIVSVRDLRNLVAEASDRLKDLRVRDVMKTELVTVRRRDHVFDAIFKMSKFNIHRLAILNDDGTLAGVLTDTDLLSLQTQSPLYQRQEIANAESISELQKLGVRMLESVKSATRVGADTESLVQLISHFNDEITLRLIQLMQRDEGLVLPAGAAYLALGSEGREEQTLRTDQDSALVYRDDLDAKELLQIEAFCTRLVELLEAVGVPRCPGNTMASNPQWRRSLSEWKNLLANWISNPEAESLVNFGMFQDFRTIYGDISLENALRDHILAWVKRNNLFLPYSARNILGFKPPIGMFGRLHVERRGEHRGKIDLKKGGIFALTAGVTLLALEQEITGGSTWEKIDLLKERGGFSINDLETIEESFSYLVHLRLSRQLRALAAGEKPSNHIDPMVMTDKERDRLRAALKGAGVLQGIIRARFRTDSIAR